MSAPTQAVFGIRPSRPPSVPFISVIVPVRNEAAFIQQTLEHLLEQRYDLDRFEVLVIDGQSTDATREIVRAMQADYPNLKLYSNPRRLSSAARNIGVKHALGEVLVVVDGHCELNNADYLRDVAEAFLHSGADCLGRPQPLEVEGSSRLQRAIAAARSSWLGHHPASFVYSATEQFVPPQSVAVAYRRSVFETVGLFDERFDACEDFEFNHRVDQAGLSCFFTPRIRVRYCPRPSLRGLFRQMARYGRGRMRLLRKHPDTFSISSMVPALFVLGLMVGTVASWFSPALAVAFAAVLALYSCLVAGVSLGIALRLRQGLLFPFLPLVFLAVHLGCGWGVLRESVSVRRGSVKAVTASSPQPVATGN